MAQPLRETEPGLRARVHVTRITHSDRKCVHSYYTMPVESADGQRITYFEFDRPRVNRNDPSSLEGTLMVANPDGSEPEPVARMKGSPAQGGMGQWAGPTRRLAANSGYDHFWTIIDTETGHTWRGTEHLREISPDGRYMFVQTPEQIHIWAEDRGQHLTPDDVAALIVDYETGAIDVRISLSDVLAVHPDAEAMRQQHICFKQTLFGPDGAHISFVLSNRWYRLNRRDEPDRKEIMVANRDGTELRLLGSLAAHPSWHPSGEHVFAVANDAAGAARFMLYPLDGSEPVILGDDWSGGGHPSIQPVHHRYLVADLYDEAAGVATLRLHDLERGTYEDLLQAAYDDYSNESGTHLHPTWTRDGTSIHIASAHLGHAQVYRVDLE